MESKYCVACGQSFLPRPQTPHQTFCSASSCQRTRKQQWQRNKLQVDPDYQENQKRVQKDWLKRNPGYYRQYRASHPDYVAENRFQQRKRNHKPNLTPLQRWMCQTGLFLYHPGYIRSNWSEVQQLQRWTCGLLN
jgi:hypothetical protein